MRVLLPVAGALAEAHECGVVHRDLKPENVVLAQGDVLVPKVIDFGIAKLIGPEPTARFTRTGAVLGSPDYMSPEQARGRPDVDERTDVWSFCVVLYEAITGRRPFEGDNYHALLYAIVEHVPAPTTDFAAGDAELWAILERGLSKSPKDRWATMRSLGQALAAWVAAQGVDTDVTGMSLSAVWLHDALPPPPKDPAGHVLPVAYADTLPSPSRARAWSWALPPAIVLLVLAGVALRLNAARGRVPPPHQAPVDITAPCLAVASPPPKPGPPLEPPSPPPMEPTLPASAASGKPAPPAAKQGHRVTPARRAMVPAMPLPAQPDF